MGVQSPSTLPTDTTGVSRVGIRRVHLRYKLEFQSIKIKFQYIKVE